MSNFIKFYNNKLYLLNIKILQGKIKNGLLDIYIFGIKIFSIKNKLLTVGTIFKENKSFDCRSIDDNINQISCSVLNKYKVKIANKTDQNKIGYLATRLFDSSGGHTKCLIRLVESMSSEFENYVYLTNLQKTKKDAKNTLEFLNKISIIRSIEESYLFFDRLIYKYFKTIVADSPYALFIFIDPDDVFSSALIAALKRYSNIKLIFYNHASHFPVLGMNFCHINIDTLSSIEKFTHHYRKFYKTYVIPLQSRQKCDVRYYSLSEKRRFLESIGIPPNSIVTMSGAQGYKFFDNDSKSDYFELIARLLNQVDDLYHVLISNFSSDQFNLIKLIMSKHNHDIFKRIRFLNFSTDFDLYFQSCDLFIDSFPVSSAYTFIELMKDKVPYVVKININKPEYSFHEYQSPKFKYMFSDLRSLENNILKLLNNKRLRYLMAESNYNFWLETYESSVVKEKFIKLINKSL